ncbi:MAG: DNA (cytosine-5-)-methyltransferase [Saprospiraceae bacterium]|nr:DNA (cytosine-5-)-methyltransferase [Candidatus Opimibacter skivensis]
MALGEQIQKIRNGLGLTQEGFAELLDVSFSTVNRWEMNRATPRISTLEEIKRVAVKNKIKVLDKEVSKKKPIAYALFAGAGGFHLGMEQFFNVLVANDIEPGAQATHKLNWPKLPFLLKDIRQVSADELLKLAGGKKPDIIFGGPPCQGFSTLGSKISGDPRNVLFDHYARLVAELNPKCFVFENVKTLTTMYNGRFRDSILKKFSELGYDVYEKILNSADYGFPDFANGLFFLVQKYQNPLSFLKLLMVMEWLNLIIQ